MLSDNSLDGLIARVRAATPTNLTGLTDDTGEASRLPLAIREQSPWLINLDAQVAASAGVLSPSWFMVLSEDAFIEAAYRHLLGRQPDSSGALGYRDALRLGASRISVLVSLARSPECRSRGVTFTRWRLLLVLTLVEKLLTRLGCPGPMRRLMAGIESRWIIRPLTEGVMQMWSLLGRVSAGQAEQRDGLSQAKRQALDDYYLAFEHANRGSEAEIRGKLWPYKDWAESVALLKRPVLDLGAGRGEWLGLLKEWGVDARGIDTSAAMVETCLARGLTVSRLDAESALRQCVDRSLAGISAFHLIEHLPFPVLFGLVAEASRVLMPGGWLLFETPNPENVLVGSHTFYHDFSHRNPITPSAITFLLHYHGFEVIEIRRLNPYPPDAPVPGDDALTARLNGHLYGAQDFAIIARRAATPTDQPA